jgi:hypothetical protein
LGNAPAQQRLEHLPVGRLDASNHSPNGADGDSPYP